MHDLIAVTTSWVMPTHTGTEALAFLLRWFHFLAGITWIGLLYFFNLVNVPFMKQVDAAHEAESLSIHDPANAAVVPLERSGYGFRGLLVLGTSSTWPPTPSGWGSSSLSTIGLFLLLWIVAGASSIL